MLVSGFSKLFIRPETSKQSSSPFLGTPSLGDGIPVWWHLLLRLLLGQRLLQPGAFSGVVLPVQQLLLVYELGALGVDQLLPEVFVLQQLQHVQTVRIPEREEHIFIYKNTQSREIDSFLKYETESR